MCVCPGASPQLPIPTPPSVCVPRTSPARPGSLTLTSQTCPGWEGAALPPRPDTHRFSPVVPARLRNGVKYCKVLRLPEVSGAAPSRPRHCLSLSILPPPRSPGLGRVDHFRGESTALAERSAGRGLDSDVGPPSAPPALCQSQWDWGGRGWRVPPRGRWVCGEASLGESV